MRRTRAVVRELLPLLPSGSRGFLRGYMIASCLLALLDMAALAFVAAAVPALLPGASASVDLPIVGEVDTSPVVLLAGVAGAVILKAILGVALQWVLTRRFATYELAVGDELLAAYLRAPWEQRASYNSAVLVRVADSGIANTVMGVLLPYAQAAAEVATFVAVVVAVTFLDPLLALITLAYLGAMALGLVAVMSRRAVVAGRVNRDYAFRTASLITEAVAALKEITLRHRTSEVLGRVHDLRTHTARARANISFLSTTPRYVMESGLIIGFGVVGVVAYLIAGGGDDGAAAAATAVSVFGVAGFRLVPSITRLQAIITQTSSNVAYAQTVIDDIHRAQTLEREETAPAATSPRPEVSDQAAGSGEAPRLMRLEDVHYSYPGGHAALRGLSLDIPIGSSLALVGASGSGKSTAVDLILGLLQPTQGQITLDGARLDRVLGSWQSQVAYVPQDVILLDATIGQNVALTWDEDYDRDRAVRALERAQALDVVAMRPEGLDARVGERGLGLSGGQRQRIGIARALYSDPLVLVLDEATSALDAETEARVAAAVSDLSGEVTVITVAHRLATIRGYDRVAVLEEGRLLGVGPFDELVRTIPVFATQAGHAGLGLTADPPQTAH